LILSINLLEFLCENQEENTNFSVTKKKKSVKTKLNSEQLV